MPDFGGFISYVLISTFTPGPNNIMAMTNAAKYGYKRAIRFCFGVWIGFTVVLALCAVFCKLLQDFIPAIEPYMAVAGSLYILFLAYTTLRDKPRGGASAGGDIAIPDDERNGQAQRENEAQGGSRKTRLKTDSVLSGAVLQFVNVKCILYGITLMSTYILPYYSDIPTIALFVVLLGPPAFISTNCWALFGSVFQRVFTRRKKLVNVIMALLLVYCAVMILITTL